LYVTLTHRNLKIRTLAMDQGNGLSEGPIQVSGRSGFREKRVEGGCLHP